MELTRVDVTPYRLPFARPVTTSAGVFTSREGFILRAIAGDGTVGFADCAPWPGFGAGSARVYACLQDTEALRRGACEPIEVRSALACAIADIEARRANLPLARWLAADARLSVATHKMVSDVVSAREAVRLGYRVIKVKVAAGSVDDDVARIAAIREAVGKHVRLRLDANGGWTVNDACRALSVMADYVIDLVEEPVPGIEGMREVRERTGLRIAADESVTDIATVEEIATRGAIDGVVLKPGFLGGVVSTLALARAAAAHGLDCFVTHALESAIGRAATIHLACALPNAPVCGLASSLASDVAWLAEPVESRLAHPRGSGLGLVPRQYEVRS